MKINEQEQYDAITHCWEAHLQFHCYQTRQPSVGLKGNYHKMKQTGLGSFSGLCRQNHWVLGPWYGRPHTGYLDKVKNQIVVCSDILKNTGVTPVCPVRVLSCVLAPANNRFLTIISLPTWLSWFWWYTECVGVGVQVGKDLDSKQERGQFVAVCCFAVHVHIDWDQEQ